MFMHQQQAQQLANAILQHLVNILKPAFPISRNTTSNIFPSNSVVTLSLLNTMGYLVVGSFSTATTNGTNKQEQESYTNNS